MNQKKITALIADDEKLARDYIKELLKIHSQIEVIAEATDGSIAIELINELEPDLVFLDIQMPIKTGIDVIKNCSKHFQPIYIFVTAYDEYAIAAFDNNAIDYLLKPFDKVRFDKAIKKVFALFSNIELKENYKKLLQLFSSNFSEDLPSKNDSISKEDKFKRFPIKTNNKVELINPTDIKWIQSDSYLLNIYCKEKKYVITGKLKDIEEQLDSSIFVRIHRSVIVNVHYIKAFRPTGTGSYEVFLDDKTKLKLSRRRKDIIEKLIGSSK